ncbi:hypothetical protein [Salinicola halimionae]|uniref:hypothetical protein n=1 Tax=Salinicola halimionae TaxID=1949081 RepID=UPI001300A648|nr:hypothetical protein [Salinicola halimionae]
MGVDRGNVSFGPLEFNNDRYCRFYEGHIRSRDFKAVNITSSPVSIRSYVLSFTESEQKNIIRDLVEARSGMVLPDAEFSWLKENKRASNFAWLWLKTATANDFRELCDSSALPPVAESERECTYFDSILGRQLSKDSDHHYAQICAFFDSWLFPVSFKQNLMSGLKNKWSKSNSRPIKYDWLDGCNDTQCKWAWEYAGKNYPACSLFYPKSSVEKRDFIIAVFDTIAHGSDAMLGVMKFRKAWSQRVFRDKQEGKVPLNTYISKETKEMLDMISRRYDEKMYKTLERIIKEFHVNSGV